MSSRGLDVSGYRILLATFEETLRLRVQDVQRIKRELYNTPGP